MVVVDTSIAVKWLLPEIDSDKAKELLVRGNLAAPDLIRYEICNALVYSRQLPIEEILKSLDIFLGAEMEIYVLNPDSLKRVLALSREFQISAYDATFVALAEALKTSLITADLKLAHRTRKLGFVRTLDATL